MQHVTGLVECVFDQMCWQAQFRVSAKSYLPNESYSKFAVLFCYRLTVTVLQGTLVARSVALL